MFRLDTFEEAARRRLREKTVTRDTNESFDEGLTFGQRLADRVAELGGSWSFIIWFGLALGGWVSVNLIFARSAFDPYPFIFLNLMLSMLAAAQAPIIMMSQNRQAAKDRLAATHDYEVNLKAELEIMALHDKLDQLRTREMEGLLKKQQEQIDLLTRLIGQPELQKFPTPEQATALSNVPNALDWKREQATTDSFDILIPDMDLP